MATARGDVMLPYLMAGALVIGPYSGVDLNTLLDKPMLVREMVIELTATEVVQQATAAKLDTLHGQPVALTEAGFELNLEVQLPVGRTIFEVEAQAPDAGTDSYWLACDGARIDKPFVIPRGALGSRSFVLDITQPGKHSFSLTLRESPGSVIKTLSIAAASTKMPQPPMRAELTNAHPRIFFTADDIQAMRARLDNQRLQSFYSLPGPLTRKPPAFEPGKRNGGPFRGLGNYALGYLLAPDAEQLAAIIEWLEMATTYQTVGVDLDAEYFMEGLALSYDWLYQDLPEDLRERVRQTIARQCQLLFNASLAGATGGGLAFQQNHYWYAHLALALGAAAIYGDEPEAERWLAWAWDRYERIALTFSPDGSFHEGPSYWDYSMPTLYMYTDLYEWCSGLKIPAGDEGLCGQGQFRCQYLYPGLELTAAMEDSSVRLARPPTKLLLWEAKRFQDPVTMGLAELLNTGPSSDRFNLLWLDENLPAADVQDSIPLARYYPDVETAFARTAWEDDATYLAFVSRPLGGHKWAELCDRYHLGGTGHNHPAQNHFVLFSRGAVLAGDPGYTYEKETRNHNTVLVDGQGQYGDGEMWPAPTPGRAHITQFVTEGDITIISGDAHSAYPEDLALTRFDRTVVLAGRDLVVVYDRLAAKQPRTFSWLLHHWGHTSEGDRRWTIVRDAGQVTVVPLLPEALVGETLTYRPQFIHPHRDLTPQEPEINVLELKTGAVAEATFLVPLLINNAGQEAPPLQQLSTDDCDGVRVGDTVVAFNRGEGEMVAPLPSGQTMTTAARTLVARLRDGKLQVVTAPAQD